jgi:hypothetical protein
MSSDGRIYLHIYVMKGEEVEINNFLYKAKNSGREVQIGFSKTGKMFL